MLRSAIRSCEICDAALAETEGLICADRRACIHRAEQQRDRPLTAPCPIGRCEKALLFHESRVRPTGPIWICPDGTESKASAA
jgi:hypothetical protein